MAPVHIVQTLITLEAMHEQLVIPLLNDEFKLMLLLHVMQLQKLLKCDLY